MALLRLYAEAVSMTFIESPKKDPCRNSVPDDGRSCVHDRPFQYSVILLLLAVLHGKIDADAFLEDKLHALLSDTVTEMYKLG